MNQQQGTSRVAVILGAGASASYHGPLVNRFLDQSEDCNLWNEEFLGKNPLQVVLSARNELRKVQANTRLEIDNIEDVLSAIDTSQILRLDLTDLCSARELPSLARELIARTVEESVRSIQPLQNAKHKAAVCPLHALHRRLQSSYERVDYITFNYDLSLECALFNDEKRVVYTGEPSTQNEVSVRKLHGSVNWFRKRARNDIESSKSTQIIDPDKFFNYQVSRRSEGIIPSRNVREYFDTHSDFGTKKDSSAWDRLIIAPSFIKSLKVNQILQTWRDASSDLSKATDVIFIGYSWPQSDAVFRHLFGISTAGQSFLKSVKVVRPFFESERNLVDEHYRSLLGPSTNARYELYRAKLPGFVLRALPKVEGANIDEQHIIYNSLGQPECEDPQWKW